MVTKYYYNTASLEAPQPKQFASIDAPQSKP